MNEELKGSDRLEGESNEGRFSVIQKALCKEIPMGLGHDECHKLLDELDGKGSQHYCLLKSSVCYITSKIWKLTDYSENKS